MPSYLYHIYFADQVYRKLSAILPLDKIQFMSGNLIPDLTTDFKAEKKYSHYRKDASVEGFFVPDMVQVKKDLFEPQNPIILGMYSHLYLDYHFIEEFLIPEFVWDYENMKVINPRNKKSWDAKTFFSHQGMYGSYTEINHLLLKNGQVSHELLNEIPTELPETGIAVFDDRREKTWRDELTGYLAQKKDYTGDIFDYERLCAFIEKCADQFVEEFKKMTSSQESTNFLKKALPIGLAALAGFLLLGKKL